MTASTTESTSEAPSRDDTTHDDTGPGAIRRLGSALALPGLGAAAFVLAFVLAAGIASLKGDLAIPAAAALVAIVVIALAATRVNLAVGLYVFVIFIEASDVVGTSTGVYLLAEVLVGVVLLAVLGNRARLFKTPSAIPWILIAFTPFLIILAPSYFWAPEPIYVVERIFVFLRLLVIACVIVFAVRRFDALRAVIWALVAGGAFLGGVGAIQVFSGNYTFGFFGFGGADFEHLGVASGEQGHRLVGPIGDPNFFGQRLVVVVPLVLERIVNERRLSMRWLSAGCGFLVVFALIFTFSRGAALAMFVVAVIALFHFLRPAVAAIALAIGLAVALVIVPPSYFERLVALGQVTDTATATDAAITGRTSEALVAVNIFKDETLVGVGTAQYPHFYSDYAAVLGLDGRDLRSTHSLYLEIAAENGIVGLAMFAIAIAACIMTVRVARLRLAFLGLQRYGDMLWAVRLALYCHLISAFFLHFAYPRVFFVLIALCLGSWALVGSVDRSAVRPGGVPPLGRVAQ